MFCGDAAQAVCRFSLGQPPVAKRILKRIPMTVRKLLLPTVLTAALATPAALPAQAHAPLAPAEARASRALEAAKRSGAPALYAFLKRFPKGADLHMHLSGAVYAETFLAEAAEQGLCVDPVALTFDRPDAKPDSRLKPGACEPGHLLAADIVRKPDTAMQVLYDKLVDAFSMRSFVPYAGWSGHDQFFATFDHFGGLDKKFQGAWIDELATRAAAQNEQYLEIMNTPSFNHALAIGYKLGWPTDITDANHMQVLARLRDALLAGGLRDDVAVDTKEFRDSKTMWLFGHCQETLGQLHSDSGAGDNPVVLRKGQPDPPPGCIRIHFLCQVLRGFPPEQVFAQTLLGFELASADPDVVGINFVRAEDWRGPMANYHIEQLMLDYLHSVYPQVRISLHAGELAPGMVPPDGMSFHIREAISLGHAERIGHGIDILHEDHPADLLRQMAAKHIAVEINLTSNDVILGIKGTDHPLAAYRAAHVPWALSTDDEGVSRIDLTHEYVKGVLDQNLTYADLKQSARTSLEHAFLHGPSLWSTPDNFTRRVAPCTAPITATSQPTGACESFLSTSEHAAAQWELERRLSAFETAIH